jgi:hypothetical protein
VVRPAIAASLNPAVIPAPRSVLERPVFSVADHIYRWQDVLDAGRHWGDLATVERRAAEGVAALDRAGTVGPPLDEAEVEAAEENFRREHKLLAAEEMIAWLARWALSYEDWLAYGRRAVARERLDGGLDESIASYPPDRDRVAGALWPEAVCSGALRVWVWKLAGQLASAAALGISPGSKLADVERASEERLRHSLTQEAAARTLQARRSDWVQIECTVLELRDEGMAREAALCVAEEGMSLPKIAVRAGATVAERTLVVEEAEPDLAQALLGATAGDVVGPVAIGDSFVFAAVRGKRIPSLDDPMVQRRVEEEVRRLAIDAEIGERIRWHERP